MKVKKLSKKDKMYIVSQAPEMLQSVKVMKALFDDIKAKSFLRFTYTINDENYEITFQKVTNLGSV